MSKKEIKNYSKDKKKLIKHLWKVAEEGEFRDYNESRLLSKEEREKMKKQDV